MAANILENLKNPLVLYDGYCKLCKATVEFLVKTDKKKRLRFAALQSKIGAKLKKDTQIRLMKKEGVALYYQNNFYFRSGAIFKIFGILGGGYRLLMIFTVLPMSFWNLLYDFIAKNRYKWFGKADAIHKPVRNNERFLDKPEDLDQ